MRVALRALTVASFVTLAVFAGAPALWAAEPAYTKGAPPQSDPRGKAGEQPEPDKAKAPQGIPGVPAPKALPPEIAGECAWTGKRIVSLLARDDVDQAKRFLEFYRLFDCREVHLGPAFRCVILDDGTADEDLNARVDRCWTQAG